MQVQISLLLTARIHRIHRIHRTDHIIQAVKKWAGIVAPTIFALFIFIMPKVIVVLPAYNCARTLKMTLSDIPVGYVDDIILVDDCSNDNTVNLAHSLGLKHIYTHNANKGYGANQKTCYDNALALGGDIIIMLHPDYQYDPKLIPSILDKFSSGAKIVFASRMQKGFQAVRLGMPLYKFISNRFLTTFQNFCLRQNLTEYHTGYRAFSADVLRTINYNEFSNDFIFDNQIAIAAIEKGFTINEIYCPAKYEARSSSINFFRSVKYGLGVLYLSLKHLFNRLK